MNQNPSLRHRIFGRDIDPTVKPIPEGWEPDCDNCRWHVANCDDLYLFQSAFDGEWHANGTPRWRLTNAT